MPDRIRVTSAEYVRNIGYWQEKALEHPILITRHGRERLVLSSSARVSDAMNACQQARDEEHLRLRTIHEELASHICEGYMVLDMHGRCLRLNRSARLFLGTDDAQIVGRTLDEVFPSVAGTVVEREVRRVLETRQESAFEAESLTTAGVLFHVVIYPHPEGVAILFANITGMRRLERESARARAIAAAANATQQTAVLDLSAAGVVFERGGAVLDVDWVCRDGVHHGAVRGCGRAAVEGGVQRDAETVAGEPRGGFGGHRDRRPDGDVHDPRRVSADLGQVRDLRRVHLRNAMQRSEREFCS